MCSPTSKTGTPSAATASKVSSRRSSRARPFATTRSASPIVSRSRNDGSNACGSPPGGMIVVTETLSSQATLLTTSAQIPVVTTTEGTAGDASVASAETSVSASVPVQAAASSITAAATISHRPNAGRRLWPEAEPLGQRASASIFMCGSPMLRCRCGRVPLALYPRRSCENENQFQQL